MLKTVAILVDHTLETAKIGQSMLKSNKIRNRNNEFNAPKQILFPPVHSLLKALKTYLNKT